jgi:hypothetical protein
LLYLLSHLRTMKQKITLFLLLGVVFATFSQDLSNLKSQKAISLTGSVAARSNTFNTTDSAKSYPSFSYFLVGSPTLNIYSISLPFSFIYSNQQVTFRQPFNQFGISPSYKWITVHLGNRNLDYNKYTLSGHNMLGAGIDLTPGRWRISAAYGRLNKATKFDTTSSLLLPISFERNMVAGQLGYGRDKSNLVFSFIKALDRLNSVPLTDAFVANVTPAENLALGSKLKLRLGALFTLEAQGAFSIYTQDIATTVTVINDSMLNSRGVPLVITDNFNLNVTSNYFTAAESKLSFKNKKGVTAFVQYTRIDPNYRSMGTYFFQNDIENILVGNGFSILKKRLRFNGSIGYQHDNLNLVKKATSSRIIGSANIGLNLTKFGIDINYYNFSSDQTPKVIKFADSLRIAQTTQNLSITPRYIIMGTQLMHTILLATTFSTINDFNRTFSSELQSRQMQTQLFMFNYTLAILKLKLNISPSINYTNLTDKKTLNNNTKGANLTVQKTLLNDKMDMSLSTGINQQNNNNFNYLGSFNVGFSITKKLRMDAGLMYNNTPATAILTNSNYISEYRSDISIIYTF